jgi:archaellum component FlaG (FlaF/FlaG flagellin family)
MSADASVSHMTFFIAAVVVAVAISGVVIGISNSIGDDIRNKGTNMADKLATDITIINDPTQMPYNEGVLTLYIKNTGDIQLVHQQLTVLIDGQYTNYTLVESQQTDYNWNPSRVLQVQVDVALSPGDHTAKVVMRNGVYDSILFRI